MVGWQDIRGIWKLINDICSTCTNIHSQENAKNFRERGNKTQLRMRSSVNGKLFCSHIVGCKIRCWCFHELRKATFSWLPHSLACPHILPCQLPSNLLIATFRAPVNNQKGSMFNFLKQNIIACGGDCVSLAQRKFSSDVWGWTPCCVYFWLKHGVHFHGSSSVPTISNWIRNNGANLH